MDIDIKIFSQNFLVAGLSEEDIMRVSELAELKIVKGGVEIIKLGSKDPDLYVIIDGTASVYRHEGALLGQRGPGEVLGEVALVDGYPRSAYVVSKGNLTYAQIDGNKLRKFMVDNKDVGFIIFGNLSRVLSKRLREASAKVEELSGKLADPWIYTG